MLLLIRRIIVGVWVFFVSLTTVAGGYTDIPEFFGDLYKLLQKVSNQRFDNWLATNWQQITLLCLLLSFIVFALYYLIYEPESYQRRVANRFRRMKIRKNVQISESHAITKSEEVKSRE